MILIERLGSSRTNKGSPGIVHHNERPESTGSVGSDPVESYQCRTEIGAVCYGVKTEELLVRVPVQNSQCAGSLTKACWYGFQSKNSVQVVDRLAGYEFPVNKNLK